MDSDEQHQFFVINLEGGSPGFDVMMLDCIWVPEFARAGWLADLTPRSRRTSSTRTSPPRSRRRRMAGRVWGLPWNMNVGLLYYRADLLAQVRPAPPETCDGARRRRSERIRAAERDPRLDGYPLAGQAVRGADRERRSRRSGPTAPRLLGEDGASSRIRRARRRRCAFMRGLIETRREPAVDHRRRRGADAPRLRRRRRHLPAELALRARSLRACRTPRCAGRWASRRCRATRGRRRAARARRAARTSASPGHAPSRPRPRRWRAFLTSEPAQRAMTVRAPRSSPTRAALYHDAGPRARAVRRCPLIARRSRSRGGRGR